MEVVCNFGAVFGDDGFGVENLVSPLKCGVEEDEGGACGQDGSQLPFLKMEKRNDGVFYKFEVCVKGQRNQRVDLWVCRKTFW